jgi:DNA invertase Pin-like site-specific DNA recombinase
MKFYRALICFGDGKPFKTIIMAKNGADAQDQGFRSHPGALTVHVYSAISTQEGGDSTPEMGRASQSLAKHPLSGFDKQDKISLAIQLRKEGLSYSQIAEKVGAGKTTVRTWMANMKVY